MESKEPPKNHYADWKKEVKNGYMGLIKGSLNKYAVLEHDTILNNIIRLLVNVSYN